MTMRPALYRMRCAAVVMLAASIASCTTISGETPVLIPNRALAVSRSLVIPADTLVLAVGVYFLIDPLAPNWHVEALDLGAQRFIIAMTKKRYTTGGDGEAMQVFRRQAARIASERGYAGFDVLEFSEGIESNVPIAQRVSRGVVQFARAVQP